MVCLTVLLFIVSLTVSKAAPLHCTDQQLPASGDELWPDLQQVATIDYCLVDECTIMIDTGEKLDIAYTTDSLLVTAPTDGRTSAVIAKQESELPCVEQHSTFFRLQLQYAELVMFLLVAILSGYIIAIHVAFKELRSLFGKLLMLYNVGILWSCVSILLVMLQVIHSLPFCYTRIISFSLAIVYTEAISTCLLSHIVSTMRRSYKLRSQMSNETSKRHFRSYMIYTIGMILLVLLLMICYDMATGNYKDTLLPNGQCGQVEVKSYGALAAVFTANGINKIAQLVLFVTYLYYSYKLYKDVSDAGISNDHLSLMHKIATAMGMLIGLHYFLAVSPAIFSLDITLVGPFIIGAFLIQQCTIIAILLCTKKVYNLCRDCLKTD